jgi:hypothetical protein
MPAVVRSSADNTHPAVAWLAGLGYSCGMRSALPIDVSRAPRRRLAAANDNVAPKVEERRPSSRIPRLWGADTANAFALYLLMAGGVVAAGCTAVLGALAIVWLD